MARRRRPTPSSSSGPFLRRITLDPTDVDLARHPFDVPALADLDLELDTNVTFLVGENGSGKSTLLEAVATCCGFSPEGGSRDHHFGTRDEPGELAKALRLSWRPKVTDGFFMRAESFFNFATYLDGTESTLARYGGVSLHAQSHGESFLALFANRFDRGIYLLDEPEAALSPQRQLSFLKLIHDLETSGRAQFLIASHSPILLAYPGATLLGLDGGPLRRVRWEETSHFVITRDFLASPERFFAHLFAEPDDDDV